MTSPSRAGILAAALALVLSAAPLVSAESGDEGCAHVKYIPVADVTGAILREVRGTYELGVQVREQGHEVLLAVVIDPELCGGDPQEILDALGAFEDGPTSSKSTPDAKDALHLLP